MRTHFNPANMKTVRLIISIALLAAVSTAAQRPATIQQARQYCDTTTLDKIEGIWDLQADGVQVLIYRSHTAPNAPYDLIVVNTYDASLPWGFPIGTLTPTGAPRQYTLTLYTRIKNNKPASPKTFAVQTNTEYSSLLIRKPDKGFRISITPTVLLPGLWRMFRLTWQHRPTQEVTGMIKVYPVSYADPNSPDFPYYF